MIKNEEIKFRYTRGKGKGGQHKNKTDSCVHAKHIPTGIEVMVDGRDQHKNKKAAIIALSKKVEEYYQNIKADKKKKVRDTAIKKKGYIRTYHYKTKKVYDHRSGKVAPLIKFMKGKINLRKFSLPEEKV
jgi:protein subunit release factor A